MGDPLLASALTMPVLVREVDDGQPVGRVDIEMLGGATVMTWLERGEGGEGAVKIRQLSPSGGPSPSHQIAHTGSGRASGFPRMAVFGGDIYVTWTEAYTREGSSQVRIAKVMIE